MSVPTTPSHHQQDRAAHGRTTSASTRRSRGQGAHHGGLRHVRLPEQARQDLGAAGRTGDPVADLLPPYRGLVLRRTTHDRPRDHPAAHRRPSRLLRRGKDADPASAGSSSACSVSVIENESALFQALREDLGKPAFEAYGGETGIVIADSTSPAPLRSWSGAPRQDAARQFRRAASSPRSLRRRAHRRPWNFPVS